MYGLQSGLGAEAMGPPVDPNVPVTPPDVQQQIADVWSFLGAQSSAVPAVTSVPVATPQTFSQWLNANSTMAVVGVTAFVGLLLFAKAGR
jgi:hypothetical protein